MKRSLVILAALAFVTGCASVPQTSFKVNPATGEVTLASPKEIDIEGLTADVQPGGGFKIAVKRYRSHNSADVIAAVALSNAKMAEQMGALLEKGIQASEKGAVKALLPVP